MNVEKLVRRVFAAVSVALFLLTCLPARALTDEALKQIEFEQKLNAQVSLSLPFQDEKGNAVHLGDYFGKRPVILVLGYYECPMLCTLVLNGMIESLQDIKWTIGKDFDVVNVSIDSRETPRLANAKKQSYLKRYGRNGAAEGWHFLTGDEQSIRQLAHEIGFRYAYDKEAKQFAHPSGIIFLTPAGKVSGYLFGVTFLQRDIYASLSRAGSNGIGSRIQNLVLLCFHYRPITGKYGALIMGLVRVTGVATLGFLVWLIWQGSRKGKLRMAAGAAIPESPEVVQGAPGNSRS